MAETNEQASQPTAENINIQDGGAIEGGVVEPLDDIKVRTRVREATARTIAISLIWILGLSAGVHYIAVLVLVLCDKSSQVEVLDRFFNAWLPVVAGLVGSATTYYFTKDRS